MFGWFKKDAAPTPEHLPDIVMGPDERPRPPCFSDFNHPIHAARNQRLLALEWAILWRREDAITPEDLIDSLDQLLAGRPMNRRATFREAVSMASRVISWSAERNRSQRSKRALPWVQFRLGPQECPCEAARRQEGETQSMDDPYELPLVGCDQLECLCWTRGLTQAQKDALSKD